MNQTPLADFFQTHGGILRTHQLRAAGFSHYQLKPFIQQGQVHKVKQGLYRWYTADQGELPEVIGIVPNGVLCLLTAAQHYELTTFVASAYHIAIPRKDKVILPDHPPIHLYYWNQTAYQLGRTTTVIDSTVLPIYDPEKTVCDVLRQRHKLGLDLAKEVLTAYLRRTDRQIARLMDYAQQLGLGRYLESSLNLLL